MDKNIFVICHLCVSLLSASSALFQDDGDALTTADAGGTHRVLSSPAPVEINSWHYSKQPHRQRFALMCSGNRSPELMDQVGGDARS